MKTAARHILLFCLLLATDRAPAQQYFKLLDSPEKSYNKKIARFPNGDMLVGDSPLAPLSPDKNISIFLMRLDKCGDTIWTKKYELGKYYLELNDMKISGTGDIYLYGSAYANSQELIFLAKVNADGEVLRFRLFNPLFIDHFTYTIELSSDRIVVFGLLLHWSVPKRGLVAVFNHDLQFQWGKSFTPFESASEGIITRDKGYLFRSGPYLYKLDAQGDLQWANILETAPGVYPLAGPLEVDNGYLLEASGPDFGFFYKVDLNGNFVWKSDRFPVAKTPPDMALQPDGNILAAWNGPGDLGENAPCVLTLTPQGKIQHARKLAPGQAIDTGPLALSVDEDGTVNIAGSANPYITKPDKITDFLLQFSPDSLSGDCFHWEPIYNLNPNHIPLQFTPLDTVTVDAAMNDVTAGSFLVNSLDVKMQDLCAPSVLANRVEVDTLLPCDQPWEVSLPGPGFEWADGSKENPRRLFQAGVYEALDRRDCRQPLTWQYRLEKQACTCSVYLPNAFSPNGDGRNDRLEFSANCTPVQWQITVYDRWGNRVFESRDPDAFWDGTFKNKPVLPGVYMVAVIYQMTDNNGSLQNGQLARDVVLIR